MTPPSPAPSGRPGFIAFLERNWWVGVAGIATLATLLWAIFVWTDDSPHTVNNNSVTNGDCNAQGAGNTVNCPAPAKSK